MLAFPPHGAADFLKAYLRCTSDHHAAFELRLVLKAVVARQPAVVATMMEDLAFAVVYLNFIYLK
jgi:hypothetical protein